MECKTHPAYRGLRIPRNGCEGCMAVYNHNKGVKVEETKPTIEAKAQVKEPEKKEVKGSEKVKAEKIQLPTVPKTLKSNNIEENNTGLESGSAGTSDIRITVEEAMLVLGKKADEILSAIIDKKLADARMTISKELDVSYEHLWLIDAGYSSTVLKNLENEGWQYCFYSYPLAKNGIIPGGREHFTFKRLKRKENKPIPDFDNSAVKAAYNKPR